MFQCAFMERTNYGAALAASTGGLGSCSRSAKRRGRDEDGEDALARAKRLHKAQEVRLAQCCVIAVPRVTPPPGPLADACWRALSW